MRRAEAEIWSHSLLVNADTDGYVLIGVVSGDNILEGLVSTGRAIDHYQKTNMKICIIGNSCN